LDELVERANRNNTSIQVAAARLRQARAFVQATQADRAPQVSADAGAARVGGIVNGVPGPARSLYSTGVNLSYEVDLFGRLAQATDAAVLDAQAREALLQSAGLLVQAEVAQTDLERRALDTERALVRSTVGAYRDTLSLTERRFRAGDVAELDVARARTEVAATESDALALDRRRAELEHALAVLIGEVSSSFTLGAADWNTALPVIPAGVPSTVLSRRPDVSAAQSSLLAAPAGGAVRGAGSRRRLGQPLDRAFRRALPQRLRQPARSARRATQRAAQPAPGAAGALGSVPEHGGARPGAGRRLELMISGGG